MTNFADHLDRARTSVEASLLHLDDAAEAHERDDPQGVKEAHANLRRCLRSAQQAFRAMASDQEINGKTKIIQTSDGVDESGGSNTGRAGRSPLMTGDVKGWLDRARAGSRR